MAKLSEKMQAIIDEMARGAEIVDRRHGFVCIRRISDGETIMGKKLTRTHIKALRKRGLIRPMPYNTLATFSAYYGLTAAGRAAASKAKDDDCAADDDGPAGGTGANHHSPFGMGA